MAIDALLPPQGPMPIEAEMRYRTVMEGLNSISPQYQGLDGQELAIALTSPAVVKTDIGTEDEPCPLPQLSPLENYSWLNKEFYEKRFGDVPIRHLQDLPGIQPGEAVIEGLQNLADQHGVLVFDYPDADPDYPERIKQYLAQAGIEGGEVEELGGQNYFAGKISLKAGFDPQKPILTLAESFESLKAKGIGADRQNGATFYTSMDPDVVKSIFPAYQAAFEKIQDNPCRQGYNLEEFEAETTQNEKSAKLVYNVDGEPSSICVFGDNLDEYPWLNTNVYRDLFPQEYDNEQIFYFPAIATDPEKRGAMNTKPLIQYICKMLGEGNNEAIIAFDCCDDNAEFLPQFIELFVNPTPEAELHFNQIGRQKYAAIRLQPAA